MVVSIIHEKSTQRASWAFHGIDGWYIGPSPEHYRCVKCFVPHARKERDVNTVSVHPYAVEFPAVSTQDYLKQASDDNPKGYFPYLEGRDQTKNAYLKIAQLLNRTATSPDLGHHPIVQPDLIPTQTPVQRVIPNPDFRQTDASAFRNRAIVSPTRV